MERRQLQIERGRPPKEEQLCLATSVKFTIIKVNLTRVCSTSTNSNQTLGLIQGEENRFVNKRDALADAFARNIQRGVFVDGRDAVRQAPLPKVYSDAKEAWNKVWSDSEKEDGDVEQIQLGSWYEYEQSTEKINTRNHP